MKNDHHGTNRKFALVVWGVKQDGGRLADLLISYSGQAVGFFQTTEVLSLSMFKIVVSRTYTYKYVNRASFRGLDILVYSDMNLL